MIADVDLGSPIGDDLLVESSGERQAAVLGAAVAVNRRGDRDHVEWSARLTAWAHPLAEWTDPRVWATS